jgi:hypothetical protein
MKNNMKKIIITSFIFMFFLSPSAEAARFEFGKNIMKRQKANVISSEASRDCERIEKISENFSSRVNGLSSTKNASLAEKTSALQEAWAKEDSIVNEKREEIKSSIEQKFTKLEKNIPEEKALDLQVFENKIFTAIEKRNSSISSVNEEYRGAIISYLSEYGTKKETSFESFEKNVEDKIIEAKKSCQENKDFNIGEVEKIMRSEKDGIQSNLAGEHFREFAETKRKERDQKILTIKETFDKEIGDAKEDFINF